MSQSTAKARVTLSFEAKLGEMEFFLKMIESEWKATILELEQKGQLKDLTHQERVNYFFSGFSNSFQSIKDVLNSITGAAPWSAFSSIENFSFIKNSRNAITHDGLQLISTFNDGRYYVEHAGGSLRRYDDKNNEVEIPCPAEEIVTVCKRFYLDLLKIIKEIIEANPLSFEVGNQDVSIMVAQSINENSVVPDFVKDMLKGNKTLIGDAVAQMGKYNSSALIKKIDERISKSSSEST
ncbi:hypothetical protein [Pseudogulbenkiania subflava]|uniref:Uncharacterized protein n=1 Tax=Pseudogulbenkiania subflava DSM 22618 TaxID=1123014 RepID=A0A1Y6BBY9_9NEIS|nr:hypothetical protein [Pseudogulbenkiania subflava]SMF03274.1 hypothetical protein SAMN02745746_00867 [Pseudogulbenkiania subflava DSM 22618]